LKNYKVIFANFRKSKEYPKDNQKGGYRVIIRFIIMNLETGFGIDAFQINQVWGKMSIDMFKSDA
jgi:hypothetical protein